MNPCVAGGEFDTIGQRSLTKLPPMPDDVRTMDDFKLVYADTPGIRKAGGNSH